MKDKEEGLLTTAEGELTPPSLLDLFLRNGLRGPHVSPFDAMRGPFL